MTDLEKQELRSIIREEILPFSKKALTLKEASIVTSLTERTIYKKTSLGEIPHYKQSGKLFFDRLELESWLLENRGFSKEDISRAAATYNMNVQLNNR
ncbi:helix-turn-helix domain-containing protein [Carboxylicivirga marina]|uniref:helix-turn-helix domain-containing protein n=1 Tax=Carboxylicivirga marina TaxID=2800988 RepID=UPI00259A820C|nr:helix-turn-helix domain-containing protein [uncultured Carboxylicivirga sp.]